MSYKKPKKVELKSLRGRGIIHCYRCVFTNENGEVLDDIFPYDADDMIPNLGDTFSASPKDHVWTLKYKELVSVDVVTLSS